MILATTIKHRKYIVPTDDEKEALALLAKAGIPKNHVMLLEIGQVEFSKTGVLKI
jgi:hypothetical protein